MLSLAFALLAALPPSGAVSDACGLQPLGWTPDGSFFVFKQAQILFASGNPEGVRVVYATVMDAAASTEERYLLEPTGEGEGDHARLARLELPAPQGEAFSQWLAAHPLQGASYKPSCSSKALQVRGDNAVVAWKDGGFAFEAARPGPVDLMAAVRSVGATYTSARWHLHGAAQKAGTMRGQVLGVCSPNTLRVAWLSCRAGDEADGAAQPPEAAVLLGPAAGPRIELLGSESLDPAILRRATEALARAGFVPSRRSTDADARKHSVVYAPKDLLALAQRVAKAIPGGATVEPLTGRSDCDMVVAVSAPPR